MSENPFVPKPEFARCLAHPVTQCGANDSSAYQAWVCLPDWLEGYRPEGSRLIKVEKGVDPR